MFQHAKFSIPRRNEGYTTDDNARALIACVRYHRLKGEEEIVSLAKVYLAFLQYMQKPEGSFHNYLSYDRRFLDVDSSDDCMGRALWSCGCVVNSILPRDLRLVSRDIFDKGLPWVWKSLSLRGYGFTILGLCQYYYAYRTDKNIIESIEKLSDNLLQRYQDTAKDDWRWFEPYLTYDNARLTQALWEAYLIIGKEEYFEVAKESMDFLLKTQMIDGFYVPIGNDGWYQKGGERAIYDQQPLEASAMVEASLSAFYATLNKNYAKVARSVFDWYLGKNTQRVMVYNPLTAGCFDGITCESLNLNQGAESSISYLLARLELERLEKLALDKVSF